MERPISDHEQKELISTFLEIAVGHTVETAIHCLRSSRWNLEEAINFFFMYNREEERQVPLPLPSKMDTLYDSSSSSSSSSSMNNTSFAPEEVWDSRLSSLYRLPHNLLFRGSFEEAKSTSLRENRWLLVNLQSKTEFASHTLNRDVWSNDTVSQTIQSSFVFLQVYDHIIQGQKISTFYKIESPPPVVLLIEPNTGQHMRTWIGVIEPQSFLEDLMLYIDASPHEYIASKTSTKYFASSPNNHVSPSCGTEFDETEHDEEEACLSSHLLDFPDLTEEPNGECDRSIVCSLCIRFSDGRRKQRKFLKTEPIQLLWSFCYSLMEASEKKKKMFKLIQAIPGASKTLDYGAYVTFDQSGLANSIVSVTWE